MWTWCKDAVFACVQWVYNFCGDWGLAIIIITIIFRALIYPITSKQLKSSYHMQKMQPKIQEIQQKYAGDQQRISEETMKIYADNKFNPLAGCLPMLLQMPIFLVLFQVLRDYLPEGASFYGLVPNLGASAKDIIAASGIGSSIPYIILILLFGASMLIPVLLQKNGNNQTRIMMGVMCVFMLWIGYTSPGGVLLYWDVSSYIGVAQQLITQRVMAAKDKKEEEEVVDLEPVAVDVERKVKKARPTKKS